MPQDGQLERHGRRDGLGARDVDGHGPMSTQRRKESDHMVRRMILGGLATIALVGASVGAAQAQVSVNIGINLPTPPSLVIVPGTPVAYAPAVPANYFFYGEQYYVF